MTEPEATNATVGQKPDAPEIRCACGETFDTIKELEEHASRYHRK